MGKVNTWIRYQGGRGRGRGEGEREGEGEGEGERKNEMYFTRLVSASLSSLLRSFFARSRRSQR